MTHNVDAPTARRIGAEIDAAVKEILGRYGLEATTSKLKYGPSFGYAVSGNTVNLNDAGINLDSEAARAWQTLGVYELNILGYSKDDVLAKDLLGVEWEQQGRTFKFTGFNARRPKFPLEGVDVLNGKGYKFPISSLRHIVKSYQQSKAVA